jgi:hypothetical protein
MRTLAAMALLATGCAEAWAQPRRDAGAPRLDAAVRDASVRDATVRDATVRDAAVRDVSARDAGRRDAAVRDGGAQDAAEVVRPPTHGRIEPAEVQRVLATRTDALRQCYQRELQHDATLRGEVTVRVRVEEDGSVSETRSGGDPVMLAVGRCIEGVLRPLRFPRPAGGPATVAAPFVFAPGE